MGEGKRGKRFQSLLFFFPRTYFSSSFLDDGVFSRDALSFIELHRLMFISVKPLSVKILNKPMEMISDQDYLIKCEVTGSRPRANITWLRDKREFRRGSVSIVSLGVFRVIYARVVITI